MTILRQIASAMALVAFAVAANASLLTLQPGSKTINNVNVATGASLQVNGGTLQLTTVGAGLRSKKVLFVNVPVYVGVLLLDKPQTINRDPNAVLASLESNTTVAFQMNFVHAVTSDQLMVAFRDGFTANNISTTQAPVAALLNSVSTSGDLSVGQVITFVLDKNNDGTETLQLEDQNGKVTKINGPKGFTETVLALWMGQSSDPGVGELKSEILKGM